MQIKDESEFPKLREQLKLWRKRFPMFSHDVNQIEKIIELHIQYHSIAMVFHRQTRSKKYLEDAEKELEEAAACLGANRLQIFSLVIFPAILPALLTGAALAFARALGEYGSVIFIAGNMPMISEITPLLIVTKLEQYDYAGATAIAVVMLGASFIMLLAINLLQAWMRREGQKEKR